MSLSCGIPGLAEKAAMEQQYRELVIAHRKAQKLIAVLKRQKVLLEAVSLLQISTQEFERTIGQGSCHQVTPK